MSECVVSRANEHIATMDVRRMRFQRVARNYAATRTGRLSTWMVPGVRRQGVKVQWHTVFSSP